MFSSSLFVGETGLMGLEARAVVSSCCQDYSVLDLSSLNAAMSLPRGDKGCSTTIRCAAAVVFSDVWPSLFLFTTMIG